MPELTAFVGHSFLELDAPVVRSFLDFFDTVASLGIGFSWDHAEQAEARELPSKVLAKLEGKNLLIAICTLKEVVAQPSSITTIPLVMSRKLVPAYDLEQKASDWIIQEIGCAVGRDMEVLVLLEEGLRVPGGLQGDREYVSFRRVNPQASFPKILEFLRSLTAERVPAHPVATAQALRGPDESDAAETEAPSDAPVEEWTSREFESALLTSIARDDEHAEERISRAFHVRYGADDEEEKGRWEALRLYYRARLKRADTLVQIIDIANRHPDNPEILTILARSYEAFGQDDTAGRSFQKSSNLTQDTEDRTRRLCWAAEAFARAGNLPAALELVAALRSPEHPDPLALPVTLAGLADVFKVMKDDDAYEALSEAYLELRPDDHERRFALAYHYSQVSQTDLAYCHYDIISKTAPSQMAWNNLGAAAEALQCPATSVHAYRESEQLGETLAMSNLANKFIDAGFLPEAEAIAAKAMSIPNFDKRAATSMGRIGPVLDAERTKLLEVVTKTKPRLLFFRDFARGFLHSPPEPFTSRWKGPNCILQAHFDGHLFTASGTYPGKLAPLVVPLLTAVGQKSTEIGLVHILYIAEIGGRAAPFKQWATDGRSPNPEKDKPTGTGLLLLTSDPTQIRVYHHGNRETEVLYDLLRIDEATASS